MKKLLIIGIPVLLLLGGVGAYVLMSNRDTAPQSSGGQSPQSEMKGEDASGENGSNPFSGSLKDLLALGKNYMCVFDTTDENANNSKGTAYIAGGGEKLNVASTLTQKNGTQTQSNVIQSEGYSYVWGSSSGQGFKMKIDPQGKSMFESSGSGSKSTSISEDQPMDFDCRPWIVDNSKFVPPANIEFQDFSTSLMPVQESQGDGANLQCSACDQVPAGPSRDQCLASLGCN